MLLLFEMIIKGTSSLKVYINIPPLDLLIFRFGSEDPAFATDLARRSQGLRGQQYLPLVWKTSSNILSRSLVICRDKAIAWIFRLEGNTTQQSAEHVARYY